MEVTFLFWNLDTKPLHAQLANIVVNNQVDIVIVAECVRENGVIEAELNRVSPRIFRASRPRVPSHEVEKIHIFSQFNPSNITTQQSGGDNRLAIRRIQVGNSPEFLLAAVHLPSKLNNGDRAQQSYAERIVKRIQLAEEDAATRRTIVVGDFNMNPFDGGMITADGFQAVMTAHRAKKISRLALGEPRQYFYNPMWGCFGDRTPGPAGTYHYDATTEKDYWNIYDQVILRPELIDHLKFVRILENDGVNPLVSPNGIPLGETASDHLPLLFQIDL